MMKRFSVAALAASAVVTLPALAADLGGSARNVWGTRAQASEPTPRAASWTGCHIGLLAGYGISSNNATASFGGTPFLGIDGLSGQSAEVGAAAGCDLQTGQLVLGVFGDYVWGDHDTTITLGGISVTTSLREQWSIGGRAGLLVRPDTLLYGLVAYGRAYHDDIVAGGLATLAVPDFSGWGFGGGIEALITPNISARIEGRLTRYDSEAVPIPGAPGVGLAFEPDVLSVRAGLAYRFPIGR